MKTTIETRSMNLYNGHAYFFLKCQQQPALPGIAVYPAVLANTGKKYHRLAAIRCRIAASLLLKDAVYWAHYS